MKPENLLNFANGLTEGEQIELLAVLHGVSLAQSAIARKVPVAEAHGDRCGLLAKAGAADLIQLQAKLLQVLWESLSEDRGIQRCYLEAKSVERIKAGRKTRITLIAKDTPLPSPGSLLLVSGYDLVLEVVSSRIENLQAITPQDAIAEGIDFDQYNDPPSPCDEIRAGNAFIGEWWDQWEANPKVLVIHFKVSSA